MLATLLAVCLVLMGVMLWVYRIVRESLASGIDACESDRHVDSRARLDEAAWSRRRFSRNPCMSFFTRTLSDPFGADRDALRRGRYGVIEVERRPARGHSPAALAQDRFGAGGRMAGAPAARANRRAIAACCITTSRGAAPNYLALKYVVSQRDCTLATIHRAAEVLDEVARVEAQRRHRVRRVEPADFRAAVGALGLGAAQAEPLAPPLHQALLRRLSARGGQSRARDDRGTVGC